MFNLLFPKPKFYDLTTESGVNYPELLLGTKDKGPNIPQLVVCSSCNKAWTNQTQAGICSKCKEIEDINNSFTSQVVMFKR